MKRNRSEKSLQTYRPTNAFEGFARAACFSISRSRHTQDAYWSDFGHWMAFCRKVNIDPARPPDEAGTAWIESMHTAGVPPKTRSRRVAGLCSIYRRLCRKRGDGADSGVTNNPFSLDNLERERKPAAIEPTPPAPPAAVKAILATCEDSELGWRDAALIRILWGTGARRGGLIGLTFERLRKERGEYVATLVTKGNREVRVLIKGAALTAFKRWLDVLEGGGFTKGPIWRTKTGVMTEKMLWHMLRRRGTLAKLDKPVSPHMFRVSFITYNKAGLEAKQDAAGHADVNTTRMYDRANWRGREAFEKMTEVEDTEED